METITSASTPSEFPTFKIKPTNFLALVNEDSIRGKSVIDPSIRIPSSILPPLIVAPRRNICWQAPPSLVTRRIYELNIIEELIGWYFSRLFFFADERLSVIMLRMAPLTGAENKAMCMTGAVCAAANLFPSC